MNPGVVLLFPGGRKGGRGPGPLGRLPVAQVYGQLPKALCYQDSRSSRGQGKVAVGGNTGRSGAHLGSRSSSTHHLPLIAVGPWASDTPY
jgi:hypothetical protein